ncbi:MAG: methylenetetrahydrofolate reductase C-terminal domain-containing protein, partial [Geodermatophilaceae bacterium]
WPRPTRPAWSARSMYLLHHVLTPGRLKRLFARFLERHQRLYTLFTRAEKQIKGGAFGCRMCGQCTLPATGYACPMTCPKQLRNGPCGGVSATGACEVYPAERCVWVTAYERAEQEGRVSDLTLLQRPIDHREWGRSSWVNYWQGRDDDLWTPDAGLTRTHLVLTDLRLHAGGTQK